MFASIISNPKRSPSSSYLSSKNVSEDMTPTKSTMVVAMPISTKAFVMARAKANKSNFPIRPDATNVTVVVAHV